jgi:hypothetical protein
MQKGVLYQVTKLSTQEQNLPQKSTLSSFLDSKFNWDNKQTSNLFSADAFSSAILLDSQEPYESAFRDEMRRQRL